MNIQLQNNWYWIETIIEFNKSIEFDGLVRVPFKWVSAVEIFTAEMGYAAVVHGQENKHLDQQVTRLHFGLITFDLML